jgi:hypothetical protein
LNAVDLSGDLISKAWSRRPSRSRAAGSWAAGENLQFWCGLRAQEQSADLTGAPRRLVFLAEQWSGFGGGAP